ncbi:histidine phosphatase family protein [Rhodococcus rhodnii]|uniref:Histidine phosphatase family protein n=1 Tax=Rhodococcus rhodnii TaxID=38312 RepID=A0A6P2CMA3_9NOCA|nr:histidine phosphatase family protein [Rhodococcus rhodnii]
MRTVYLARHGETGLNAEGRIRGLADPPLDDVGVAEAGRLAEVLAEVAPSVVVTGPLERAVATGRAIADAARAPLLTDERLNDRDYGEWTGAVRAEVIERFGSVDAAPGVEPRGDLDRRVLAAFLDLVDEFDTEPVVFVSHDAFNTTLIGMIDPSLGDVRQRTACWNLLRYRDGHWIVELYDQKP